MECPMIRHELCSLLMVLQEEWPVHRLRHAHEQVIQLSSAICNLTYGSLSKRSHEDEHKSQSGSSGDAQNFTNSSTNSCEPPSCLPHIPSQSQRQNAFDPGAHLLLKHFQQHMATNLEGTNETSLYESLLDESGERFGPLLEDAASGDADDLLDEEEDDDGLIYFSVVLSKTEPEERFGLTLYYETCVEDSSCMDVIVSEIEEGSLAHQDGRIRVGDQIIEVNGVEILSRSQVMELFQLNSLEVSLVLGREIASFNESDMVEKPKGESDEGGNYTDVKECDVGNHSPLHEEALEQFRVSTAEIPATDPQPLPPPAAAAMLTGSGLNASHNERTTADPRLESHADFDIDLELDHLTKTMHVLAYERQQLMFLKRRRDMDSRKQHPTIIPGSPFNISDLTSCDKAVKDSRTISPKTSTTTSPPSNLVNDTSDSSLTQQWFSEVNTKCTNEQAPIKSMNNGFINFANRSTDKESLSNSSGILYNPSAGSSCSTKLTMELMPAPPNTSQEFSGSMLSLTEPVKHPIVSGYTSRHHHYPYHGSPGRSSRHHHSHHSQHSPHSNGPTFHQKFMSPEEEAAANNSQQQHSKVNNDLQESQKRRLLSGPSMDGSRKDSRRGSSSKPMTEASHRTRSTDDNFTGTETQQQPQQQMEWVLKRRPDGSRYVTRRPVKQSQLRQRTRRRAEERYEGGENQLLTTDDDAMSEMKMGRYWSRAERRKHVERAKEHRRHKAATRTGTSSSSMIQPYALTSTSLPPTANSPPPPMSTPGTGGGGTKNHNRLIFTSTNNAAFPVDPQPKCAPLPTTLTKQVINAPSSKTSPFALPNGGTPRKSGLPPLSGGDPNSMGYSAF